MERKRTERKKERKKFQLPTIEPKGSEFFSTKADGFGWNATPEMNTCDSSAAWRIQPSPVSRTFFPFPPSLCSTRFSSTDSIPICESRGRVSSSDTSIFLSDFPFRKTASTLASAIFKARHFAEFPPIFSVVAQLQLGRCGLCPPLIINLIGPNISSVFQSICGRHPIESFFRF